jgi:hypothetical protein
VQICLCSAAPSNRFGKIRNISGGCYALEGNQIVKDGLHPCSLMHRVPTGSELRDWYMADHTVMPVPLL